MHLGITFQLQTIRGDFSSQIFTNLRYRCPDLELISYFIHLLIKDVFVENFPGARTVLQYMAPSQSQKFSNIRRPEKVLCEWEGFRDHFRETGTGDILVEGESSCTYVHNNFYILRFEVRATKSLFCFPHPPIGVTLRSEVPFHNSSCF